MPEAPRHPRHWPTLLAAGVPSISGVHRSACLGKAKRRQRRAFPWEGTGLSHTSDLALRQRELAGERSEHGGAGTAPLTWWLTAGPCRAQCCLGGTQCTHFPVPLQMWLWRGHRCSCCTQAWRSMENSA